MDDLRKLLGITQKASTTAKGPLDSYPFPKRHIRQLLELSDAVDDSDAPGTKALRRHELWEFIHNTLPITRGKSCKLSVSNALRPVIEVLSDALSEPVVGKCYDDDNTPVTWAGRFPDEAVHQLLERCGAESAIDRYELWTYIQGLFPDRDFAAKSYCIVLTPSWKGVYTRE